MEDLKDIIISTALDKFKQYGIKSISVDDICREIGISKKTFYNYYPGKEELVASVLNRMNQQIDTNARKYMEGKTALECMRIITEMPNKMGDVHKIPTFSYDLRKYYPKLYKQHIQNVHKGVKEIIMIHLQQGKDEGVYRQDLDVEMCALMFSLIQQGFIRNEEEIRTISPKRLMTFAMESFIRSIISEEGVRQLNANGDTITKHTNK